MDNIRQPLLADNIIGLLGFMDDYQAHKNRSLILMFKQICL